MNESTRKQDYVYCASGKFQSLTIGIGDNGCSRNPRPNALASIRRNPSYGYSLTRSRYSDRTTFGAPTMGE